jgi:dolichol-phosphate mannosyltransferase
VRRRFGDLFAGRSSNVNEKSESSLNPLKPIVVIPTYNERDNLERLAKLVLSLDPAIHLLVVDDNSPDGTGAVAERLAAETGRVSVLHRAGKLGLGSAYREGFARALAMDADLVVQMDADFSHDPSILPVFFEKMSDCDLVIGSRYLNGVSVVNWPLRRLMLSYFASVYTRVITGLTISDCTSGFKCFRSQALRAIDLTGIRSDGYSFQIEMNYRLVELGFKVAEVPIIFIDRHAGSSKMSKRIVREAVLMVWKLKLGSLLRLFLPKGRG